MAMRAFRRNLNYAQRTRMVNDPELRRAELERIQREFTNREVIEFITAHDEAYAATEMTPQFRASPAGAYFPVFMNVYLQAARARILQIYGSLFVSDGVGGVTPVNTVFDWDPFAQVYAYHPPLPVPVEPFEAEE